MPPVAATGRGMILSLFPGIGLLDRAFEDCGFTIVRGPDVIWGGDVRKFHTTSGHFCGVIGGPPCQLFSLSNRLRNVTAGMELVNEYLRIVDEAQPPWWLMENTPGSPDFYQFKNYAVQRIMLEASQLGSEQHRLRKFHFGHRPGTREIVLQRGERGRVTVQPTCLASEGKRRGRRSWAEFCRLQGLPDGFDLPPFKITEKYRAVGNGVPYPLALALARAIVNRDRAVTPHRLCECGCGEFVIGKARLASVACRKRMQRKRDTETTPGPVTAELF